jgi:hypothetical protein
VSLSARRDRRDPVFDEQLMLVSPEGHADIRLAAFRGCSYRAIAEAFFA